MNRFTPLLFLLVFLFSGCHQHANKLQPATQTANEQKGPAKFEFQNEIHNFGTLKAGEVVSFSFQFENAGGTPLTITKVKNECGCLQILYPKKPIQPGEKSTIEVIFSTDGEWGNDFKAIEIETQSGLKKQIAVTAHIENKQFEKLINTK